MTYSLFPPPPPHAPPRVFPGPRHVVGTAAGFQAHASLSLTNTSQGRTALYGRSIALSPDARMLAVSDSGSGVVWVYTSSDDSGTTRVASTWSELKTLSVVEVASQTLGPGVGAVHASTLSDYLVGSDVGLAWAGPCLHVGTPLTGSLRFGLLREKVACVCWLCAGCVGGMLGVW